MDRAGKAKVREAVSERFGKANAVYMAEFRGLKVEEVTQLRVALRKANADFKVVKNRLVKKAIEADHKDMAVVSTKLKGPLGLICAYGDSAAAAKVLTEFQKDHPNFVLTAGYMEKQGLSVDDVKAIADLPPKEVLLAKIIGSLVAPHRGLVGVIHGIPRGVVGVINAIKDKKTN